MSEWQRSKFQAPAVRQRRNFGHRNRDLPPGAKVGKNAIQTFGLKIRPRYALSILIPCTARSRYIAVVVPYDELTFLLRRCRSCGATVEVEALFVKPVSGSGAVAETVL